MSYLEKLFPSTSLNSTMPPARTSSNPNTTKRAPFKAPSRVASGGATTKTTKSKGPAASKAKTGFQSAKAIELSDDAESDDNEEEEVPVKQPVKSKAKGKAPARQERDSDIDMDSDGVSEVDEPAPPARKPAAKRTLDPAMPIPPKLLTRILWEGFEDKDMKIGKEAMSVVGKYVETFVREAVARAIFERRGDEENDELGDGFLQVCHLIQWVLFALFC
jgi:CENP-S associating Centromere protein X